MQPRKGARRAVEVICIFFGHHEALRFLLSRGADVHATDEYGSTPMHYACANQNAQALEMLRQAGASAVMSNVLGHTPRVLAAGVACHRHAGCMKGWRRGRFQACLPGDHTPDADESDSRGPVDDLCSCRVAGALDGLALVDPLWQCLCGHCLGAHPAGRGSQRSAVLPNLQRPREGWIGACRTKVPWAYSSGSCLPSVTCTRYMVNMNMKVFSQS